MIVKDQIIDINVSIGTGSRNKWFWDASIKAHPISDTGMIMGKSHGYGFGAGGPFDTFTEAAAEAEKGIEKIKAEEEIIEEGL